MRASKRHRSALGPILSSMQKFGERGRAKRAKAEAQSEKRLPVGVPRVPVTQQHNTQMQQPAHVSSSHRQHNTQPKQEHQTTTRLSLPCHVLGCTCEWGEWCVCAPGGQRRVWACVCVCARVSACTCVCVCVVEPLRPGLPR